MPKAKWAKFTYVGKETKFITRLFKNTPPENCFHNTKYYRKITIQTTKP